MTNKPMTVDDLLDDFACDCYHICDCREAFKKLVFSFLEQESEPLVEALEKIVLVWEGSNFETKSVRIAKEALTAYRLSHPEKEGSS